MCRLWQRQLLRRLLSLIFRSHLQLTHSVQDAQVGSDHAPIVAQRRLLISSPTASFVSGSKNGLSMSRNASRHHSCGDIPLASFIGFSGGASYRVSQPVKANPRISTISTWIIRRGYE